MRFTLVTDKFSRFLQPSPISTIVLPVRELHAITNPAVRVGVILRALRFVSPYPWGSPRAEAGRRASSLKQIMEKIWGTPPSPSSNTSRKPFIAGGGVLWSPVTVTASGELKNREPKEAKLSRERAAWLLTRQAPQRLVGGSVSGLTSRAGPQALLDVDVSCLLRDWVTKTRRSDKGTTIGRRNEPSSYPDKLEVLYDCRFLIRITPSLLPSNILNRFTVSKGTNTVSSRTSSIYIISHTQYTLPRIVLRLYDRARGALELVEELELARLLPSGTVVYGVVPSKYSAEDSLEDVKNEPEGNRRGESESTLANRDTRLNKSTLPAGAIEMHWIRSLDADGADLERVGTIRVKPIRSTRMIQQV